jgi:hypothetical protein
VVVDDHHTRVGSGRGERDEAAQKHLELGV